MAAPNLVVIEHGDNEGPGLIADVAANHGLNIWRLNGDDPLPQLDNVDALVLMGGPMAVYDGDPRMAAEIALAHDAVAGGLPVLGVCLGAQLLAAACGAAVRLGENGLELGLSEVSLTAPGTDDPIFAGVDETLPALQWHSDTFDLPRGASHLARSGQYSNQAFRLGRAYGFQFHLEVDDQLWRGWAPHMPEHPDAEAWLKRTEPQRRAVLQAWVRQALPPG